MLNLRIQSATDAWIDLIHCLIQSKSVVSPRGMGTREILGYQSRIDMSQPIVLNKARKLSYRFMAAEAWWILSGRSDVASISKYCKNIAKFSDDGETFFGAYGPKVVDQVGHIVDSLRNDQDSRQAVLTIWRENPPKTKDVPCTVSLQWLIRDDELHCVANMRSSDAWLGWPYDVFNFSMLSWEILRQLRASTPDLEIGTLILNAGSQHLYDKNLSTLNDWTSRQFAESIQFDTLAGVRTGRSMTSNLSSVIGENGIILESETEFFQHFQHKLLHL